MLLLFHFHPFIHTFLFISHKIKSTHFPFFKIKQIKQQKSNQNNLKNDKIGIGWAAKGPKEKFAYYTYFDKQENSGMLFFAMTWAVGKYMGEKEFTGANLRETKPFGGVKWHPGSNGHHLIGFFPFFL